MKKIENLGRNLSKIEQKKIAGGGSCCAHSGDWSESSCGLSQAQAQQGAQTMGYWCCASCPKT